MSVQPKWVEKIKGWRDKYVRKEFLSVRQEAEDEARKMLKAHLKHFDQESLKYLLILFTKELYNNKISISRFRPAFLGANRNGIAGCLDSFNKWSTRLWQASESNLGSLLDEFWQRKNPDRTKGAGTSLPTMILYLRDPLSYNVWTPYLAQGFECITGSFIGLKEHGATYLRYNEEVKKFRILYNLQPQEVDFILYKANKEPA